MNCKPGDLAIVVKATRTPEMVGHLVTVVRRIFPGEIYAPGQELSQDAAAPAWLCKSEHAGGIPNRFWGSDRVAYFPERPIFDECLRPIRPGDLEDETPTVRELEAA